MKAFQNLCFLLLLAVVAGCTTSSKPASEPVSSKATKTNQKNEDVINVVSGDFAAVLAEVEGRELDPKDPEQALAEALDQLEANSSAPTGSSVSDAIVIPGRLDLWKRQKVEVRWVQMHFPKQKMVMHSIIMKRKEGKWYDVLSTTDKVGGEVHHFHFDVTDSFTTKEKQAP
ncbi:MAG: hypothetical protein ACOX2U_08435 [Limisphaerales bacterium]|jgi:hypothetical protein|nr:hypothetical protein [Verrucomicrobiota bacterium]